MAKNFLLITSCLLFAFAVSGRDKQTTLPSLHEKRGFIENKGQVTDQFGSSRTDIDFKVAAAKGLNIFIGKGSLHYQWVKSGIQTSTPLAGGHRSPAPAPTDMYRMDVQLIGANTDAIVTHEDALPYSERYYLPSVPSSGVASHSYSCITYHDIYPGIDWVLYFNAEGRLEYDFIIRPGGHTADIKLQYGGATGLKLNSNGSLTATTPYGLVTEHAPFAYELDSKKKISSSLLLTKDILSFSTANHKGTLILDPIVEWGTYFGGNDVDNIFDVTKGEDGKVYVTGGTSSTGNIATIGAFQSTFGGGSYPGSNDAFLAKFDINGNCIWSTYYGSSAEDAAKSISCDTSGNLYIGGYTYSTTGLATTGAHQQAGGGDYDAFVAKFDTSGQRIWATYFGGAGADCDAIVGLVCDRNNNIYLTGQTSSSNGIATTGAYQTSLYAGTGDQDAFLAKFNTAGTLLWGTYFGGNLGDAAYAITSDTAGNVFIAGISNSTVGIATTGSQQAINGGSYDAFLTKFNPAGNLIWSTYLGGDGDDYGLSICCDDTANIYITGLTTSTTGLATSNAYQSSYGGGYQDAILAKYNNNGVLNFATYYGGSSEDEGDKVFCAKNGGIYLSGFTGSTTGMVTTDGFQTSLGGYYDGLISRFNTTGVLNWGSYIGGADVDEAFSLAADSSGNLFIAGNTMSGTGIATPGSYQPAYGGEYDGFLLHIKDCTAPLIPVAITGNVNVCAGSTSTYTCNSSNATSYNWILPNGWTGSSDSGSITVTFNGNNGTVKVVAINDCYVSDTVSLSITVSPLPATPEISLSGGTLSVSQPYNSYQWNLNGTSIPGATAFAYTPAISGSYSVTVTNANGCGATSASFTFTPTGIHDVLAQNGINVYPNPFNGFIIIEIPVQAMVMIYSVDGRKAFEQPLHSGVNKLNLMDVATGVYSLRIIDAKGLLLGATQMVKSAD